MGRPVVVLDDDRITAKIAEQALTEMGHEVVAFTDPAEARAYLGENRVDLLVLDLQMPKISGVDILRWIREFNPFTRVVTMTGCAPVNTLLECWRLGADCCVLKGADFVRMLREASTQSIAATELWERSIETVRASSRMATPTR